MELFSADPARREQILAAALDLLAHTPIDGLTTRDIAKAIGVSQPALFRHFRSREAILVAVAERARTALESELVALLGPDAPADRAPLDDCATLGRLLVGYIARHPGLPRLLYADLGGDLPALRMALGRLVSMQRALVAERVAEAVQRGEARSDCDPAAAADLFVAMLQGLPLAARVLDLPPAAWPDRFEAQLCLWLAGLRPTAGAPQHNPAPLVVAPQLKLAALDVRPILASGRDPLTDILAALTPLAAGALLVVTAPFRPRPLEALLVGKGHWVTAVGGEGGAWSLLIGVHGAVPIVDLRDLEPPEPLQRAVAMGRGLHAGQGAFVHTPRSPRWLPQQLHAIGCQCDWVELADLSAIAHIRRPA